MTNGAWLLPLVACSGPFADADQRRLASDGPVVQIGVVHEGAIYAAKSSLAVYRGDLTGKDARVWQIGPFFGGPDWVEESGDFPPRWKLGHDELLLVNVSASAGPYKREIATFGLPLAAIERQIASLRADLPQKVDKDNEVVEITIEHYDTKDERKAGRRNIADFMYEQVRRFVNERDKVTTEGQQFSKYELFYDVLPAKGGAWDFVVLGSEALQEDIEQARKRNIVSVTCDGKWKGAKEPLKPMLGIWHNDEYGQWALIEKIKDRCFNERFHVFPAGGAYFFVTDSGKLYVARKPDKGERKIEEVWVDKKRPITAAITDTASGNTFLFGAASNDSPKLFYFQLAEKPEVCEFDRKALVKNDFPLSLYSPAAYANLLRADKKIKFEAKPKP